MIIPEIRDFFSKFPGIPGIPGIFLKFEREREREREIFIQLHIRNTFKIYKLNTKQSCAHSSQKRLLWSTQNKNIFILFHLKNIRTTIL